MTLEGELPLVQREVAFYETIWLSAAQTSREERVLNGQVELGCQQPSGLGEDALSST